MAGSGTLRWRMAVLATASASVVACGSASDSPTANDPLTPTPCRTGVLISGYRARSETAPAAAFLFRDGRPQSLPLPLDAADPVSAALRTTGVVGTCSDVYVSGDYAFADPWARDAPAGFWRNGVWTPLTEAGVSAAQTAGMALSAGEVFVGGSVGGQEVFWKNGIITRLPRDPVLFNNHASGIALSGQDVYVTSLYSSGSPSYVKNLERVDLPLPTKFGGAHIRAIALSGTDVYIAGIGYPRDDPAARAVMYWTNGVRTDLAEARSSYLGVLDIEVAGGDVYVAGYHPLDSTHSTGCYWKNGQRIDVPSLVAVSRIAVRGRDVHLIGNAPAANGGRPTYILNGAETVLMDDPRVRVSGLYVE